MALRCALGLVLLRLLLDASTARAQDGAGDGEPFGGACPDGCECVANTRGRHGCKLEVRCGARARAFPKTYDDATDCVMLNSPFLARLKPEEKQQLLDALPAKIRLLDLSLSGLGAQGGLPAAAFARFSRLRFLNLEFCQLTALPADSFDGPVAASLRTLWLTGNHWQPEEQGYKLREKLGNRIELLDGALFKGCTALQVLLMHHNRLVSLDDALFRDVKRLRVLKLLDNEFDPPLTRHTASLAQLVDNVGVKVCSKGRPSEGECLQLDIHDDTGDALEDIWDEYGMSLASDKNLDDFMQRVHSKASRREL